MKFRWIWPALALAGGVAGEVHAGLRPIGFEENLGQTDPQVRFFARGPGHLLFLTPSEAVLSLRGGVVRLRWEGAVPSPRLLGEGELPGRSNYLVGNDTSRWRTGVRSYARVRYEGIYPGTDLLFYGSAGRFEYDFVLAPGADPGRLRLAVEGVDRIEAGPLGDMVLGAGPEKVRLRKPVSYQEIGGVRREVASAWRRLADGRLGFEVGAYDPSRELVIDPVVVYATWLGGSDEEQGLGLAVDPAGNAYVTGHTRSPDFPALGGSPGFSPPPAHPSYDAFVTKLSPSGALVYSTQIGGTSTDSAKAVAVDAAGQAYVTGETLSPDFPLAHPLPPEHRGEVAGAFVSKLSRDGASLVYSTTLGGVSDSEIGSSIAVDAAGSAYITGNTFSPEFPQVNGLGFDYANPSAFAVKLAPSGSSLAYSTFLSADPTWALAVAVDAAGHAHVTGTRADGLDVWTVKLHPSGSSRVYQTFFGGSGSEGGYGIALDAAGNAWITGWTSSPDLATSNGLRRSLLGPNDAFVARLSPAGALTYATYLGGSEGEHGRDIAVDAQGRIYVAGDTLSADFPLRNPVDSVCRSSDPYELCYEAFVTQLAPQGTGILFSSYFGGSSTENAFSVAADAAGQNVWLAGTTYSPDFPKVNASQPAFAGASDAWVARIALNRPPVCSAASASPSTVLFFSGSLVSVAIQGVTDPDGDPLTLRVTAIRQDEPTLDGPDASGIGTSKPQVRAERIIGGDGRVYHLYFDAADGKGGACSGKVTVCVPPDHSTGAACRDSGPRFDSTGGAS